MAELTGFCAGNLLIEFPLHTCFDFCSLFLWLVELFRFVGFRQQRLISFRSGACGGGAGGMGVLRQLCGCNGTGLRDTGINLKLFPQAGGKPPG